MKVLKILSALSREQHRRFRHHLTVDQERNRDLLALYDCIRRYPTSNRRKRIELTAEYLAQRLYSSSTAVSKVKKTGNDLKKALNTFLVNCKVENHKSVEYQLALAEAYEKLELREQRMKTLENINKELNNKENKDRFDYARLDQVNRQLYYLCYQDHGNTLSYLKAAADNLELSYLLERLEINCEAVGRSRTMGEHKSLPIKELDLTEEQLKHPSVLVYHTMFHALKTPTYLRYKTARQCLETHYKSMADTDSRKCFNYLGNVLSQLVRTDGNSQLLQDAFEQNNFGLESGLVFSDENILSGTQFSNFVNIACALDELKWTYEFIEEYAKYLEENIRIKEVDLAKATVLIKEQKFKAAQEVLQHRNSWKTFDNIRANMLEIIICYELFLNQNEEKIWNAINNFKRATYRTKGISKAVLSSMRNFVTFVEKFLHEETPKQSLVSAIKKADNLYLKSWLLEKVNTYKPRYLSGVAKV